MSKIFSSYRRSGVKTQIYRIGDELKRQFGRENVFIDIDSLPPGVDYDQYIEDTINRSSFVLFIIGPEWLEMKDREGNRKLDNPEDPIRKEIVRALNSKATVIPVFVDGAQDLYDANLPDDIARIKKKQIATIAESHWDHDLEKLINAIDPKKKNIVTERKGALAITSLVISTLITLMYIGDDYDNEAVLVALVMSLIALTLSAYAYKKTNPESTTNKAICITGIVLGALLTVVSIGEYEEDDLNSVPDLPSGYLETY